MKFSEIKQESELIQYLNDESQRLNDRKWIYHYTTLEKCIKIFQTKLWFLSSADHMNDQIEHKNGDSSRWKNILFASFMADADESIGMWSVYSQPWSAGVQVAIPVESARKWVKGVTCIREISCVNFNPTGRITKCGESCKVFLSSVAYSNCDNSGGEEEKLTWSTARNTLIKNATHRPALTGYIKDMAWDYEKEIRIKAEFLNTDGWGKAAIDIPNDILDSFVITAGPLFEGSLIQRLERELKRQYQTDTSMFARKLRISSPCDQCTYKQK